MRRTETRKEISARIENLQSLLAANAVDGALIVQKANLYYFTATDQDAHLWVPARGDPLLLVRRSLARARMDGATESILPAGGMSDLPERIREHSGALPARLGLEMDVLPANLYLACLRRFPGVEPVDVSHLTRKARMVKSRREIDWIRKAAALADRMFERVPSLLRDSQTEADLAWRIESFYRAEGHPGMIRTRTFNMECIYGQVISGRWGAMPGTSTGATAGKGAGPFFSQSASRKNIAPHSPVMVDYAANMGGYISDQTRVFSKGDPDEKFLLAHATMVDIQDRLAQRIRPGARTVELYAEALRMAEEAGLGEGFMGHPDPVPFVGHGVGLEIDEWPVIGGGTSVTLVPGMVLALEPKFVFPGEGAVGVESTWLVTARGAEKLNRFPDGVVIC